MVKVLQVIYGMNIGGAETFIFNVLSALDNEKYHIDFVIQDKNITNKKLYSLCKIKGCHIYVVSPFYKNFPKYIRDMKSIIKMSYDIIHIHANALINIAPIFLAKKYKKKIIIHSHNTNNNSGGKFGQIIHYINRRILENITTTNVACGNLAGEWMFGSKEYLVLDNAVSIEKYSFNEEIRKKIREQYQVEDKIVVGHVGRFVKAKNHEYLLYIFSRFLKKYKNAVLMLVGDGPLMEEIIQKAKELSITEHVIFVGNQSQVSSFYSAFDCLLFPSLFEGLPFVLVEAQASGLPIIASDKVTKEIDLTGNMKFLSLEDEECLWISAMEKAVNCVDRLLYGEKMKFTKYNIDVMIEKVIQLYEIECTSYDT